MSEPLTLAQARDAVLAKMAIGSPAHFTGDENLPLVDALLACHLRSLAGEGLEGAVKAAWDMYVQCGSSPRHWVEAAAPLIRAPLLVEIENLKAERGERIQAQAEAEMWRIKFVSLEASDQEHLRAYLEVKRGIHERLETAEAQLREARDQLAATGRERDIAKQERDDFELELERVVKERDRARRTTLEQNVKDLHAHGYHEAANFLDGCQTT